ncbi:MAG: Crp/Fnr family transcriptional regulator [Flavobacterium sp.]|uniref:Crp/Fnr family transcriptional regulator n=1 Tax=Flavobacterium sp. TaxID=239 RepID=UPI00121C570B|nr:Crp/Fnr family transcriptional regulator [Flavobacterium sp.]RZJ67505.1 MAG: Crp/Fnr family transcriptional regulator [Flavobacterium sp.]
MDELINYLLRFTQLNPTQIEFIKSKLTPVSLKKGDYFSEAGKIAQQVGFVVEGVTRVCFYNNKGDEFTRCFMPENRFAVDFNSFMNDFPCSEYVEALTDCKILVFNRPEFLELSRIIPDWDQTMSKIMADAFRKKISDVNEMLASDATDRYLKFLEKNPGLANRIPLSVIASYMGITQQSLSRIRKNV